MPVTESQVIEALRPVHDPELRRSIIDLGMVRGVAIDGLRVNVQVALTVPGCPLKAEIQQSVDAAVVALEGGDVVGVDFTVMSDAEREELRERLHGDPSATAGTNPTFGHSEGRSVPFAEANSSTRVLLIASGKGGVGKSSVTVNLAAELANRGFTVGVMDADIWGFSVPRMLGVEGRLGGSPESGKITPITKQVGAGHLEVVSMGFLVEGEETALMWRGLILNRAVQHFCEDVAWGDLDYLLIDMPPGTGDVQMGLAKMLPRAEMLIVTTPALAAQKVAVRVAHMGRNNYLRIVGVVENMSAYVTPDGESHELFGAGGGNDLAERIGAPLLGSIPIDAAVAAGGDAGKPVVLGEGPAADVYRSIVELLATEAAPPLDMEGCSARLLAAAEAALDELVVVVGAVDLGVCLPEGATVLENPDWASGQAGSLQVAVAHCRTAGHDAIVFGLADTPGVPASAWRSVAEQPGELVCATFGGRRRPPVKVAASLWPDLPADGDEGARALLAQQASQVVEVVCPGEPRDIDTVEDLRAWS